MGHSGGSTASTCTTQPDCGDVNVLHLWQHLSPIQVSALIQMNSVKKDSNEALVRIEGVLQ
jgi:hypothetical protein